MESGIEESPAVSVLPPRLPFLVLKLLLDYLDIFALMTMRLVCKKTKEDVETAKLLRHFRVRITGPARLEKVLHAPDPVPWNSFIFTEKWHHISRSAIQRFVKTHGNRVVHLEMDGCKWKNKRQAQRNARCLLLGCRNLESLHIGAWIFGPVKDKWIPRLLANWENMRHFHVTMFCIDSVILLPAMRFFAQILASCDQLKTLTLPNFDRCPITLNSDRKSLMLPPLLKAVKKGRIRSVTLRLQWLFDDELLMSLARACQKTNTVLYNVTEQFLKNLTPEHLSVLDVMGDLKCVTDTIIRQSLTNVRRMKLASMNFQIENNAYTVPPFPHLRDVEINLTNPLKVDNQESLELFVDRLAKVRRPTVQNLTISYTVVPRPHPLSVSISPADLCTSFLNLRVLHVGFWKGGEEDWLQLWPLVGQNLVELELHDCPNLTDRAIVGDDLSQPAFLQLKVLRKLSVIRSQNDQLTDLSFLNAFRHLRLRSFKFSVLDDGRCISGKTLKAMWKGPFGTTIQEFNLYGKNVKRPTWWRRWWEKATKGLQS